VAAAGWRRQWPTWLAGALLVFAGVLKAGRPLEFGRAIEGYQLLPSALVPLAAAWLPWLEVVTGALLCAGRWRLGAALVAVGLGLGFLVAGGSVLVRGLDAECGCFGGLGGSVGALTLVVELAYLAGAGWAAREAFSAAARPR